MQEKILQSVEAYIEKETNKTNSVKEWVISDTHFYHENVIKYEKDIIVIS